MNRDFLKYLLGLLLFGSNGVVASFIHLPSQVIVLLRSLLGSIFLLLLFLLGGGRFSIRRYKRDAFFICLSGIAMAADWLLLFEAYARIGVSLGMIINYCGPILVILASAVIFHEKITGKTIAALLLALFGAVLISWQGMESGIDRTGLLLAVLSAFAIAAMVILNKMSGNVTGMENSVLQLSATFVVVAVYAVFRKNSLVLPARLDILPVLWLGVINTGMGCYLYFSPLGRLKAQTVAICGYLEPLSAVFFSMLILHERLLPLQAAGAVMILAGTMIINLQKTMRFF